MPNEKNSLEEILSPLDPERKSRILEILRRTGITDEEDVLFQVVLVLGIYAEYFQTLPRNLGLALQNQISEVKNLQEGWEHTVGDSLSAIEAAKTDIVHAVGTQVTYVQDAARLVSTNLEVSKERMEELREIFSNEIKTQIIDETLKGLLEQLNTVLHQSRERLEEATAHQEHACKIIKASNQQVLDDAKTQLKILKQYDLRKPWLVSFCICIPAAILLALGLAWGGLSINQLWYKHQLQQQIEIQEATLQTRWEALTQGMENQRDILRKIQQRQMEMRFLSRNGKDYIIFPKGSRLWETEKGVYMELADPSWGEIDNPLPPQID